MMIMISLGSKMKCGTCGTEDFRTEFSLLIVISPNKNKRRIYRCPSCGKTGTKEEIENRSREED